MIYWIIYIIYLPQKQKLNQILSIVIELCTVVIYILATWIAYYNMKNEYKKYKPKITNIGWVIVGGLYLIMLCNLISFIYSIIELMK